MDVSLKGGLTLIFTLHTPFQSVRGFAKAVLVHLRVHKLEYRNEAMFAFWILFLSALHP